MMSRQQVLEIFGEMGAIYDDDHFVYTAKGHGKAYVNKDDTYTDPEQLSILCKEVAFKNRNLGVQAVAGPTVGGALVANRVAEWLRHFTGEKVMAVFADPDGDGRVLKRGYPRRVNGKRVLVVEDVVNTGKSAAATVKAVQVAGGNVVACHALCNRSKDKKAAAELIGVPTRALLEVDMDNFSAEECPYCKEGRPINQELGHGKAFLDEVLAQQPEKSDWVSQMRKS